jgi:REase_MTES_1575/AAA domain
VEARAVVADLVGRLRDPEAHRRSHGVVTFSRAQQALVEDLLEDARERYPEIEPFFDPERPEPVIVKNLENIQGDERDVIILSVCYGRNPQGKILMNFGPINQAGGERRLNVAFSRARRHMALVTTLREQDVTNDYNDGARCLKNYLRYAEAVSVGDLARVRRVLWDLASLEETAATDHSDDVVLSQLTAALAERGYVWDRAVGQSSFRCDLAIRRPDERNYRLGILVDTDEYFRGTNLLERDVLKPKLLRAFGWKVALVLTKDWYEDRQRVLEEIEQAATGEEAEGDA